MRSSAIVFAVVAALTSSISATPINAGTDQCPSSCTSDDQCWECFFGLCNQFHCKVSRISSVTSMQYGTCKLLVIGQVNQRASSPIIELAWNFGSTRKCL
ncbi:uncharacterized protein F5147DRAFT_727305 [Suillus discolor]|uniref:Uncharacterized protein n=1 Tax=Suillus discolor TaxID=1912936 RepID=A0A9P7ETX5_9AGAM|nr:uncharacterized protein F5147DRAFT_727305 [Suillus discolor]KAG2088008.1 hypothetical protein F5147DRAFT_727305 [Suillus discolor]